MCRMGNSACCYNDWVRGLCTEMERAIRCSKRGKAQYRSAHMAWPHFYKYKPPGFKQSEKMYSISLLGARMTDCFYLQLYTFHYYLNLLECTNVLFFISPNITGTYVWGKERSEMDEMCVICVRSQWCCYWKRGRERPHWGSLGISVHHWHGWGWLRQAQAGSWWGRWTGERAVSAGEPLGTLPLLAFQLLTMVETHPGSPASAQLMGLWTKQ